LPRSRDTPTKAGSRRSLLRYSALSASVG
jgi:hypothetical protein